MDATEDDLAGKVAVVTGAGGGLGGAIVTALYEAGATPVLLDVDSEKLDEAASHFETLSKGRPITIACDVTDVGAIESAASQVQAQFGQCDILVNNAAILRRAELEEHPVDLWDRILAVNLRGYFLCTQAFGWPMCKGPGGSIVNIASLAADSPSFSNGAYCASKAGVLALTRSTALEWGPYRVRANAVSPAYMRTPMVEDMSPEVVASRSHIVPLGRIGDTSEIARVVTFLAGPDASYLTGINVPVDGALSSARAGGWSGPPHES
jgi:NAD(P)-dependent dehydrogenase (short-subunit alcohol dehydrogenase family)